MATKIAQHPMLTQPKLEEGLWDSHDVGRYLNMSQRTIRRKTLLGEIPARHVGSTWRYDPNEIRALGRVK